jgi:hypothetical protein
LTKDEPVRETPDLDEAMFDQALFDEALARLRSGYSEGLFEGRRWGATVKRDADLRRIWLFAEDLAGKDIVSFNLYRLACGRLSLKPCEMSTRKVIAFVLGFAPLPPAGTGMPSRGLRRKEDIR